MADHQTNPTVRALQALLNRGWAGESAFRYLALLHRMGHVDVIERLAVCARGGVGVDWALQSAAVAVAMLMVVGTLQLGLSAAWAQASAGMVDQAPVHLRLCQGSCR